MVTHQGHGIKPIQRISHGNYTGQEARSHKFRLCRSGKLPLNSRFKVTNLTRFIWAFHREKKIPHRRLYESYTVRSFLEIGSY